MVHTNVVWDELEKRKPLSLREKFEVETRRRGATPPPCQLGLTPFRWCWQVKKAMWRERKNIKRMNKLRKEKVAKGRRYCRTTLYNCTSEHL